MKILCLNCGGSSMKCQLIEMPGENTLAKADIDRMNTPQAVLNYIAGDDKRLNQSIPEATFITGIEILTEKLKEDGIIGEGNGIDAIAHKLAHGGERFNKPTVIDERVIEALESLYPLAPVHLPPAVGGIRACQELLPLVPQFAVFETNFHQTLPPYAYIYGIPYEWYERYGIRKYGFHGTSHRYVTETAADLLGKDIKQLKMVSCHLGSGTSVAAVKYGKSVEISSGLTPQSGTIMSTRPGDFDPWVFPFAVEMTGMSVQEISDTLVKRGGLLGISGVSGDMRDIQEAAAHGNERAQLALDVFCYQIKKYIGSFAAVMNGLDVLIFTGGIGEHSSDIRKKVCDDMEFLGIKLDDDKNASMPVPHILSADNSQTIIMCVKTNEELMVARQVYALVEASK